MLCSPDFVPAHVLKAWRLVLVGFTLTGFSPLSAQPKYNIVDLGTLGGTGSVEESIAFGINNSGQVVGSSRIATGQHRAFRTAPNSPINPATDNLGVLGPDSTLFQVESEADGINNSGQVVGWSRTSDGNSHAFRWDGAMTDLGNLGFPISVATRINDSGQAVGWSNTAGGPQHAFRTAPNSPINPATDDLGTLGTDSYAYGINATGQVTGYSYSSANDAYRAFRTAPNSPINPSTDNLGTLGGAYSRALGISNNGQVVGFSPTATTGFPPEAFLTARNSPINPADDLGVSGDQGFIINISSSGQYIVGRGLNAAFLVRGGVAYDLRSLIPANSGFGNLTPFAVNNAGQIAGSATLTSGAMHAVRLDPSE